MPPASLLYYTWMVIHTYQENVGAMIARFAPLQKILRAHPHPLTHTHTHPFNGPLSRTNWVSRYQKGKTNLDFTEARDSEWQWHQLGHVQVCTSLQTDNHASTPPLSFFTAFYDLPAAQPTASKHWRHKNFETISAYYINIYILRVVTSLTGFYTPIAIELETVANCHRLNSRWRHHITKLVMWIGV